MHCIVQTLNSSGIIFSRMDIQLIFIQKKSLFLKIVSRVRGDDWIYSYLRAYYEDSSKQYGVNNLVYPGTAMPNVLMALQGNQKLVCKDVPVIAKNGGEKRDDFGNTITKEKCGYLKVDEGLRERERESVCVGVRVCVRVS